jgi:hypothetical protein
MLHRMLSEANNASPETSELIKDLAAIVYLGGSIRMSSARHRQSSMRLWDGIVCPILEIRSIYRM